MRRLVFPAVVSITVVAVASVTASPAQVERGTPLLTYVALVRSSSTPSRLCVVRPDGSRPLRVTASRSGAAWTPDGRRLAFIRRSLLVTDAKGRLLRRIRTAGHLPDSAPAWSPNGRSLAWTAAGRPDSSVLFAATGSARPRIVLSGPLSGVGRVSWPAWTPDGRRIAFSTRAGGQSAYPAGIYTVAVDGTDLRLLVRGGEMVTFSPDGSKLAYVLEGEIIVSDADGTHPRPWTDTSAVEDRPAWSPDGRLLAFRRGPSTGTYERSAIVVARSDGRSERVAVGSRAYDGVHSPSWRPSAPIAVEGRPRCRSG